MLSNSFSLLSFLLLCSDWLQRKKRPKATRGHPNEKRHPYKTKHNKQTGRVKRRQQEKIRVGVAPYLASLCLTLWPHSECVYVRLYLLRRFNEFLKDLVGTTHHTKLTRWSYHTFHVSFLFVSLPPTDCCCCSLLCWGVVGGSPSPSSFRRSHKSTRRKVSQDRTRGGEKEGNEGDNYDMAWCGVDEFISHSPSLKVHAHSQ